MSNITLSCDVRQMKKVTTAFKTVNKEVLFIFKPEGLTVWSVDPSNILLLEMDANKNAFLNYSCEGEKTICIDIENLNKALSRVMEDDMLMLYLGEKSSEIRVNIVKREQKKISRNREFMFPLMESSLNFRTFNFEQPNSFQIKSLLWKTAIIDMGVSVDDYSGDFLLFLTKDKIKFQAGDKGSGKTKVEYHKSELREIKIEGETESINLSLKFIYDFFKGLPDDLLLQFKLKDKKPFICFFEMADVKLNTLESAQPFKFKLLLAPVISREEDMVSDTETEGGLELGSEVDVPNLDDRPKVEDKGLEL
jgi:hypothetical protein